MKKLYALLLFFFLFIGGGIFANTRYYDIASPAVTTLTGAATYCQNATPAVLTVKWNTCNNNVGGGPGGSVASTVTVTWYYNITATTAFSGSTVKVLRSYLQSTGTSGTVTYTLPAADVLTTTAGNYYYFAVVSAVTNTGASYCGLNITTTDSLTSTSTVEVTVNAAPTASSNSPVCYGSTLDLSSSTISGADYSWAGPNDFESYAQNTSVGEVTTADEGTYTVTANGCTGTTTVKINSPAPTVSSNTPVCNGGTLNLTSSTITGATYSWTGPNSFTSTSQNPAISPVSTAGAGTYSVTVDSSGCVGAPITTTVVVAPIAGSNSPVCVGNTLDLTATTVAGATYAWTGPNGFTSTSQNPAISAVTTAAAGNYIVIATMGACVSLPDTVKVVINATIPSAPTASSNSPACTGSIIYLYATTVSGATYSWTGPSSFSSTTQDPLIEDFTTASAGTYSVTATVEGCASPVATTSVTVNTSPAAPTAGATATTICIGANLDLTATNVAGTTYSWTGPNSFTSTSQNPVITGVTTAASGTYSVTATSTTTGCTSTDGTVAITVNTASPTASSSSPACLGSTLDLNASYVTGATYSWTGPNGFTSTSQSPTIATVTTAADGTYSVTATIGGCVSAATTTTVTVVSATAMAYGSSAVSQYTSGSITPCSANTNAIMQIAVTVTGNDCPASTITQFVFNTAGSTSPGTDIISASVYYTQQTAGFSNQYFFGSVDNPNGAFTITGSQELTLGAGTYYFYLCYNVPTTANVGDVVDATTTSFTINGTTETNMSPNPTASLTIAAGSCGTSPDLPNPPSNLQTVPAGSWVIPMDNSHQDLYLSRPFNIKAYGLVNALLQQDIPVMWVIKSGKIKDSSDFSAEASMVYPTTGSAALQYFKASEFIIDTTYINKSYYPGELTATQVMEEFAKEWKVAVYQLSSNTTVDVRYTLHFRPKIALFNNGTYQEVQKKLLDSAGISNYTAISAGVFPGLAECYTFCSEAHWSTGSQAEDSATMRPVWDFVYEGGNFLAQCAGINKYENEMQVNDHFQTTEGIASPEDATALPTDAYANPDMAYCQFNGNVAPRSGTVASYRLATNSDYFPVVYKAVTSVYGDSVVASGAHLGTTDSVGGNVFYLGGHDYMTSTTTTTAVDSIADLRYINGSRMYLNAVLVPPHRPTPTPLQAGSNVTICQGNSTTLGGSPTGPGGSAVYTWSPATGLNNSNSANPIASPTVTTTYTVYVNSDGCPYTPANVTVTVIPTPATPTASSNTPVCAGSPLNLNATTVTGATYSWTGPNSFTSSTQNPTISNVTAAASGTYSVVASISGCPGTAGTTSVTVTSLPTVTVSGPATICSGNSTTLTANGATIYSWSPATGLSATSGASVLANPTATTTYTVTGTTGSCAGTPQTVTVTVNALPTVTITGTTTICNGGSTTLTGNGANSYVWTGGPGTAGYTVSPAVNTTYTVTGTSSATGCSNTATQLVTVNALPTVTITGTTTICNGGSTTLTGNGANSYVWTGGPGTAGYTVSPATNTTYTVTGTSSATGCSNTATQLVTVNPTPATPIAGSNSPICLGGTINLTATATGTTYSWTGPNSFTSTSQNPSIAVSTLSDAGTYSVTASALGCTSAAGTTVVAVNPPPAAPTTGSNSPVCSGTTLNLTASAIANATYSWNGPNGYTSGTENPSIANVTTTDAGTYSVTATVPGCVTGPAGTVSVTVNQTPAAPTAGANTPICSGFTLNLTASATGTTYSWTGPDGFISSAQDPSITPVASANAGVYSVTATANSCTSSAGSITVVVDNPAVVSAGNNQTVCANNDVVALSGSSSTGSGSWSSSGTGAFTPNNTALNAAYTPSNADTTAGSITLTLSSLNNGACSPVTSSITITITHAPYVNAGSNQTVCANNANVSLNGSINSYATGATWTTSGSGTFSPNATTLNATYIPSSADTTAGGVTLTLTTTGNGQCEAVSSTMHITITHAPTVNAGSNVSVCKNNADISLHGTSSTGTGTWTTSGTGTFSPGSNTLNATYIASSADTAAGTVTLTLTSTGNGTCLAVNKSIIITYTPIPKVTVGHNVTVCANNDSVKLSGTSTTGSGQWSTSGTGSFSPGNTTLNATYIPSNADTTAGSVTLTLTSTNNNGCLAVTGNMTINFDHAPYANAGS
ncbi:MAG: beta strand repeat-containing protein, partial [Bacteroidia bacterium]